jgi:hypothetical protein
MLLLTRSIWGGPANQAYHGAWMGQRLQHRGEKKVRARAPVLDDLMLLQRA